MKIVNGVLTLTNEMKDIEVKGFKIIGFIISRGYIYFETINTWKYAYENGYRSKEKRKLNNKSFRFQNVTIDISKLEGMENGNN